MIDLSNMELALIQLALIHLRECPAGEEEQKLVNGLLTRAIVECAKREDQSFSPFAHTIRALAEAALPGMLSSHLAPNAWTGAIGWRDG
jgi:hypothetical protein